MGLRLSVLRGEFSPKPGRPMRDVEIVSLNATTIVVVNVPGPFNPTDDEPGYRLEPNLPGNPVLRPVDAPDEGGGWVGPMASGNYAATTDSRFGDAIGERFGFRFYGALPLHDRFETVELYQQLGI